MQNRGCHVMAKPSSAKCNIDCTYCFYTEKEKLYPDRSNWRMSEETLEVFIRQQIEAQQGSEATFAWQGGEPTLMGLAFFENAVALQKKYAGSKRISNTFQTNGILLDDAWCTFFRQNDFLVGLSLDGPVNIHNAYRLYRNGTPTFEMVIAALDLLKANDVAFNTISVINDKSLGRGAEIYRFLKDVGSKHMQFIPLVERQLSASDKYGLRLTTPENKDCPEVTAWSVTPKAYGDFLCNIFDSWIREDVGTVWVQDFENLVAAWFGYRPMSCFFAPTCGSAFALEANGDVYACDHYVYPEYLLGNIHRTTLQEVVRGEQNRHFGETKRETLSQKCVSCNFLSLCNGGCPKHRFVKTSKNDHLQNYLCKGYKDFFSHVSPVMSIMKQLHAAGHHPASIMEIIKHADKNPI